MKSYSQVGRCTFDLQPTLYLYLYVQYVLYGLNSVFVFIIHSATLCCFHLVPRRPGTHNSAINLGPETPLRPDNAIPGKFPSEAHSSYHYFVMDQRLSARDQLDMGIRVIDLEMGIRVIDLDMGIRVVDLEMASREQAERAVIMNHRQFQPPTLHAWRNII